MNSQAIATHLNILDSAIIEVQEWASVLWVKFVGGVRFVSKKIGATKMDTELVGTPKQIAWAEKIRTKFDDFRGLQARSLDWAVNGRPASGNQSALLPDPDAAERVKISALVEAWLDANVSSQTSAKWWIDNRDTNFYNQASIALRAEISEIVRG
jgi:hypothetical protein